MLTELFLNLETLDVLDERDRHALEQAISQVTTVPPHATVVRTNSRLTDCKLLLDGYVCRCKDLASGQRQIVGLHIAGDFIDLHSFLLKKLDHDIVTLTPVRMALIPHAALERLTDASPRLTQILWHSTLRDSSVHREWILSIGQRSGIGRIAHLICEMYMRNRAAGLTDGASFSFPLTQIELGEACGMTSVHTNRMLQQLRREQAVAMSMKKVRILDWDRLVEIAEFDPAYLYLESMAPLPFSSRRAQPMRLGVA